MKRSMLLAGAALSFALMPQPSFADHCGEGVADEVCAQGQGGGFELSGVSVGAGGSTGGSAGSGSAPAAPRPTTYIERSYVPTCTGNSATENGLLCGAALETCPGDGEIRFWVYTRVVTIATGARTTWELSRNPPSVCLNLADPVIDPAVAIPALVKRDFAKVVVRKGVPEVSPRPDTLVNIPTVFMTRTPRIYDIPLLLLGQQVVITATAQRYTWHFGDGESQATSGPGARVQHEYRKAGTRQAYVVIDWSGSYRINGGTPRQIAGTATTTGELVDVQVKQARTELVRD